ncbi:MAG: TldD/PmbA family protein [bacterium]
MKNSLETSATKIKDRLQRNNIKEFEVYLLQKNGTNVAFKSHIKDLLELKEACGFALRIINKQKMGFSFGVAFSDEDIDRVIQQAVNAMSYTTQDSFHKFIEKQEMSSENCFADPCFSETTLQEKIEILTNMQAKILAFDPKIKEVSQAIFEDEKQTIQIVNSNGYDEVQERTLFSLSAAVLAQNNDKKEIAYLTQAKMFMDQIDYSKLAQLVALDAIGYLGGGPIKSYEGPVILRNNVVAQLIKNLSPSFWANQIATHKSCLTDKMGKKIYSDKVTIIDNGHYEQGRCGRKFDDEGMPTQETVLVHKGVVTGLLYDFYWANKLGEKSTGNAHRESLSAKPEIHNTDLFIKPCDNSLDDLIEAMNSGIIVSNVIGMHTTNKITGELSVGIQGHVVHNGQKQQAIRQMVMTGNIHEIMKNVQIVGSDLNFFAPYGGVSLLIDPLKISGTY